MNFPNNSQKPILLFKYGGNAMTNSELQEEVLNQIGQLSDDGYQVVIVHGGGPFIQETLDEAKISSEFIDGQRKTSTEALRYVEMALKGRVNGELVAKLNFLNYPAVGLSGKDGKIVVAKKRLHPQKVDGRIELVDLGQVGDVESVDTKLLLLLLENSFLPVITCLASDQEGQDYNINGDNFAGHLAAALQVEKYIVLTDVDGLYRDKDDPSSLISHLQLKDIEGLKADKILIGGMIPKIDSCITAIEGGTKSAHIINGTVPEEIGRLLHGTGKGTKITN